MDTKTLSVINTLELDANMHIFCELDKYTNLTRNQMSDKMWCDFQMMKAFAISKALDICDNTLFMDADTFALAPITLPSESKNKKLFEKYDCLIVFFYMYM